MVVGWWSAICRLEVLVSR